MTFWSKFHSKFAFYGQVSGLFNVTRLVTSFKAKLIEQNQI